MSKESNFPEKLAKKLPTGFYEGMASADTEEIKKKILESEGNIYEVDQEQDKDEELQKARALVKDLSRAYREAKSTEAAKIKYCLYVLEERGVKI